MPCAGASPPLDVVARGIELHHRRTGLLSRADDAGAMQHPDVIVGVGRRARHLAERPAVGDLRPRRIDLKHRTFGSGGLRSGLRVDADEGDPESSRHERCRA